MKTSFSILECLYKGLTKVDQAAGDLAQKAKELEVSAQKYNFKASLEIQIMKDIKAQKMALQNVDSEDIGLS